MIIVKCDLVIDGAKMNLLLNSIYFNNYILKLFALQPPSRHRRAPNCPRSSTSVASLGVSWPASAAITRAWAPSRAPSCSSSQSPWFTFNFNFNQYFQIKLIHSFIFKKIIDFNGNFSGNYLKIRFWKWISVHCISSSCSCTKYSERRIWRPTFLCWSWWACSWTDLTLWSRPQCPLNSARTSPSEALPEPWPPLRPSSMALAPLVINHYETFFFQIITLFLNYSAFHIRLLSVCVSIYNRFTLVFNSIYDFNRLCIDL